MTPKGEVAYFSASGNTAELAKKLAAEKDGAERATLGVFANNEAAYRCYLSAGFREIPDTKEEYYHIFDDDWLCIEMECEL